MTEASAIEYAMCKLEGAKKETMDTFDKLLEDAKKIANSEYQDISLTQTNNEMSQNVE